MDPTKKDIPGVEPTYYPPTPDAPTRNAMEEIDVTLLHLINVARLARLGPSDEALQSYIDAASRSDTIAPIIDPTLWMRGHKKNDCFLKIARALQTFRASLPTMQEAMEADAVANQFERNGTP